MPADLRIVQAETPGRIEEARSLFTEYATSLGFSRCFRGFDSELADLPGAYAPPEGRLLLAYIGGELAGCVALQQLEEGICEMRRLFVRPAFRGRGLGRILALALLEDARRAGYARMRLETLPAMTEALSLYPALGFRRIDPYGPEPLEEAIFMEKGLG